ncbi:MAG: hypothetical protein ACE5OR_11950 [bacterium]
MERIFPTGTPVRGKELIGREKEVREVTALVTAALSVILIGPRRYGKTSIILEVLFRLQRGGFFVCDVNLFGVSSKEELAAKITEGTLRNAKLSVTNIIKKIKSGIKEAGQRPIFQGVCKAERDESDLSNHRV